MNEHFYIPKKHRVSIISMLSLALLLHLLSLYSSKNDKEVFIKEDLLTIQTNEQENHTRESVLTSFDPNSADNEILIQQGLSKYAAKNLIKLRSTGWQARRPEDLLEVYGIDSSDYYKFKDRIAIERTVNNKGIKKIPQAPASKLSDLPFDPNTASYQELIAQGFSKYAATNLRNYLESGARIKSKSDLKRIYGIDEEMYSAIEGRVVLSDIVEKLEIDSIMKSSERLDITSVFDPNTASLEELERQGIDRKTAYSLIHYREKGGVIREKEQLRKIYGMSDSLYVSLQDRIIIIIDTTLVSNQFFHRDSSELVNTSPDTTIYNLNTITQEELLSIKGVGPYFSKAILEYRDKLGGFYRIEQLLEVPAFKEEHYKKLQGRFRIDGNIARISPVAEFKELLRHPYIDYKLAKKFKSMSVFDMEDRIQEMISTGQIEEKLVPYLQKY